jgi:hypothetical protein
MGDDEVTVVLPWRVATGVGALMMNIVFAPILEKPATAWGLRSTAGRTASERRADRDHIE